MVRLSVFICIAVAAGLSGCTAFTPNDQDVAPVMGPAPRVNTTPMAGPLACIASQPSPRDLRIGVSDFVDGTGVMEGGTQNSRAITQRPDLMMVTALSAAGAHLVNRSSVNVAEWEMNKAIEKKLGDGHPDVVDNQTIQFRPVRTGIILGSSDYVTGAVTELNWNIDSGVAEAGAYSLNLGKRTYRISVAIDVVVTNTQTTEIVFAKSYKKQLVGFESTANFFRFFNENTAASILSLGNANATTVAQELELFDANLDQKDNEPTQTALRWIIELAAYDIMRDLKHNGSSCDTLLPSSTFDNGIAPATADASPAPAPGPFAEAAPQNTAVKPNSSVAQDASATSATVAAAPLPPPAQPVVTARTDVAAPAPAPVKPVVAARTNVAAPPPAPVKPVVAARTDAEALKQAEALMPPSAAALTSSADTSPAPRSTPHVPDEQASGSASRHPAAVVASAEKTAPVASPPSPKGERKVLAKPTSDTAAANAQATDATSSTSTSTSASAAAAASAAASTSASASTQQSGGNAQPQAPSSNGAAPIRWMSGAVPALGTQLSQAGSTGTSSQ